MEMRKKVWKRKEIVTSCPTLSQLFSGPIACLWPNHVHSSATTHLPPSTRFFQAWSTVSNPTVSFQAQPLMSHPLPTLFRPNHLSPTQPCPFGHNHSSPTSTRPACLPSTHVHLSATAHISPSPCPVEPNHLSLAQPCPFKCNHSSATSTRPFWAQLLASHPTMSIWVQLLVHPSFTTSCRAQSLVQLLIGAVLKMLWLSYISIFPIGPLWEKRAAREWCFYCRCSSDSSDCSTLL